MATKTESKRAHIEGILGEKVEEQALALIQLFQDVAIATTSDSTTVQKHLLINRPNRCFGSRAVDVSSFATTSNNGQATFFLKQFLCPANEIFSIPINVLATPISEKPFFLTVQQELVNNGADIKITVFAWDANGKPAPGVTFNWRCRVEHPQIFL
jgi:hypothetical protein